VSTAPLDSERRVVLVFVRAPGPGPVKTRLAAEIGAEAARELYRQVAEKVWQGLACPGLERWLVVEPAPAGPAAAAWLTGADRVLGQVQGDLGARMAAAFGTAFAAGANRVAVVGTDAPQVGAGRVGRALDELAEHGCVAIPAEDGGYAVLALRGPAPSLFEGVPWSTAAVLETTRAHAAAAGLSWKALDPVRDLDTLSDLLALRASGWIEAVGDARTKNA